MKKLCVLMLTLALAINACVTAPVMAGERERLEAQLTLKQTQIRAVNAEFRLAQELIRNLQNEAASVTREIADIRAQLGAIEAAKKPTGEGKKKK